MKILIDNIHLTFVVLSNFVGLNAGVRYVGPPDDVDPNPQPTLIEGVPLQQFYMEKTTLFASGGKREAGRTFNTNIVQTVPDSRYHKFFQFNILGTKLKFVFQRDEYRRLINVIKLNGNKRPARGRKYLPTYVASINGIQFLVHTSPSGTIVGASPPPNQVAKPEVENHTPRIKPKGSRRSRKRQRIASPPTHI